MTRGAAVTVILLLVALLVAAVAVPVHAQVRVEIGIQLPAPPALVVIPGTPVYYAPSAPANVFFYAHEYWIFTGDGWYVGPTWNGPWAVVEPVYVPPPILQVPVRYYPVPPPDWRGQHPTPACGASSRKRLGSIQVRQQERERRSSAHAMLRAVYHLLAEGTMSR